MNPVFSMTVRIPAFLFFRGGYLRFAATCFPDGFFAGTPPCRSEGGGASFPRRSSQNAGVRRRSRTSYSTSTASSLTRLRNMSWRHSGMCSCLVRCTRMHSTQFPWRWQRVCVQGQSSTCAGRRLGARGFFGRPFMKSSAITGGASRRTRLEGGARVRNIVWFFPCREAPPCGRGASILKL